MECKYFHESKSFINAKLDIGLFYFEIVDVTLIIYYSLYCCRESIVYYIIFHSS